MMQEGGAVFGECDVRIELAITLHEAGQPAGAADHLKQALDIADRFDFQPQRVKALETLATLGKEHTLEE